MSDEIQPEIRAFNLWCPKCKKNFTVDLEIKSGFLSITAFPKQKKVFCMTCGSETKVQGMADIVSTITKAKKAHQNEARSIEALRMANQMKQADAGMDEMVTVTSNQEGKNKGKSMQIPKKVIKSIEEKVVEATE